MCTPTWRLSGRYDAYDSQIHERPASPQGVTTPRFIHLASEAQVTHSKLDRQITEREELQAAVTARDEVIAQREETIGHREDQIVESNAIISQRNTVIEFLQEQAQDLTSELEDAYAYIEYLQEHLMPPDVPN